jgi:hypothetical protein
MSVGASGALKMREKAEMQEKLRQRALEELNRVANRKKRQQEERERQNQLRVQELQREDKRRAKGRASTLLSSGGGGDFVSSATLLGA